MCQAMIVGFLSDMTNSRYYIAMIFCQVPKIDNSEFASEGAIGEVSAVSWNPATFLPEAHITDMD